ncbi:MULTISPECIES: MATE family efflux transporter [Parabacteroides]|uniref:Multidrug export protein MepA n=5 Tax=Parabacteroides goldsteinii TaxID=328812 RepID=A0A6G1ZDE7_9BACT|nr:MULTISPECIES: MATE family efflux transporter [Parabacteroides]MBF0763593.1 MATE family efflux transporter [Parabacteroides goldsteinii]MDZ3925012.1 MATE family efflux transporter [Parabacteroides goldsteinii]MRX91949.1 MATE family efflux transporter [Parabacteroides goldsteinii]MRX97429.1 MATE family efflux transporter [Parabacteroides goldsteinii]MRY02537.1 MATE family efflux transporter [Parabacteroides goldsteinii]
MTKQNSPLVLGTERIGKLLTQYAIPAIIAMTASSLYNMADSIFIGHGVGPLAISGLALTFPLMNLAAAFGSLVGVGASTLVSVKLGQKDYEGANQVLGNVLVLNVLLGVAFTFVFLLLLNPILYFFGASENTIGYARDYMQIILYGNVITHMYLGLNAVLRSSGFPKQAMYATLASVVINCILNPIFIFGFEWGIKGSAWATVISQVISLTGQMIHFSSPKQLLHFKKGIYKLRKEVVKGILYIGMSPFLMNLCSCLIVILINRGLKEHGGDMAIGAYGIVNRIIFLFVMIIMGFNQGMQPIAGYNFGARLYPRVTEVTKLTMKWAIGVATTGFLLCQLFPTLIVNMFTTDDELVKAAVFGLHIVFAVFPIVGFQMVATNFFLSIGMSKKAIFLSLTRQMLFLIPCLIVLPRFFGTLGVWISMPVADTIATVVTAIVLVNQFKKFKHESPN